MKSRRKHLEIVEGNHTYPMVFSFSLFSFSFFSVVLKYMQLKSSSHSFLLLRSHGSDHPETQASPEISPIYLQNTFFQGAYLPN